jgi:cytochrome c peroxidase
LQLGGQRVRAFLFFPHEIVAQFDHGRNVSFGDFCITLLGGIRRLKESPYSLLGRFNDDRSGVRATGTKHVEAQHRNFGEWRVPGLRNVARTAPYMHNGSLATLRDVAAYYSNVNEDRLHADGEKILRPLRLSDEELSDLVAFLESLSSKP